IFARSTEEEGPGLERAKAIQAEMAELDEEKTAFHTGQGVYCYTKMSFGLKNVGATYQRLRDIDETFRKLRKINMKLNPKKCTFGAVEGMFLRYMNNPEGIKPRLDKNRSRTTTPVPADNQRGPEPQWEVDQSE
ncbi:hypothetical protein Tco_1514208, partial [Tanacetum coccineum]